MINLANSQTSNLKLKDHETYLIFTQNLGRVFYFIHKFNFVTLKIVNIYKKVQYLLLFFFI